jgi:type VI secretion system protein ImpM
MRIFSSTPAPTPETAGTMLAVSPRPDGPWLFGKIPAHGDFVARGLGAELRDRLDGWLSAELAAARARFPDFDERYRLAPAWHFVDRDPAGQWSGGALCLSVDGVNRRFPILLAVPAADAGDASAKARAALDLVFSALGEGWNAERLHEALGAIAPEPTGEREGETVWAIEAEDGTRVESRGRFPLGLVARMLELAE